MDGVLADFDGKCKELTGSDFDGLGSNSKERWTRFNQFDPEGRMYAWLRPMDDSWMLVNKVREWAFLYSYEVAVLSAIPKLHRMPMAKHDKRAWIEKHFPSLVSNFNIGPHAEHKQYHCAPGDILIDDKQINIDQWNKQGGVGILHTSAKDSVAQLKALKI
jgi:hypothetical protein